MEPTTEQKEAWANWLAERPENVRKVAERIVPWKKYRYNDLVGYNWVTYVPISYQEHEDGSVTVTCEKLGDEIFGGYIVFGINPDDLIEVMTQ